MLTDAIYEDASASSGSLHYKAPDLVWEGSLRPGQRVTIDIQVKTIKDPPANERLRDYVIGEGRIMGCQDGRGHECSVVTELEKSVVVPCNAAENGPPAVDAPLGFLIRPAAGPASRTANRCPRVHVCVERGRGQITAVAIEIGTPGSQNRDWRG